MTTETIWSQADPTGVTGYSTTTEGVNNTYGLYFSVSKSTNLVAIWFYSRATATSLPTGTRLYDPSDESLVAHNDSPSWSGAAGSGWVKDTSFPSTPITGGKTYVAAYYSSATLDQAYLYTGSQPAAWFPTTTDLLTAPEDIDNTIDAAHYGSNGPYLNGDDAYPVSQTSGNLNWLLDVEVEIPGVNVVQTAQINDGFSGDFDDDVTIGNTIVMVVTAHNGTGAISDPLYNGAAVDNAVEVIQDTFSTSTVSSIWILPNVQTSGQSLSITNDGDNEGTYVGIFAYEVEGLGNNPTVVQAVSAHNVGTQNQKVSGADSSAAGNFVIAGIVQDVTAGSDIPVGSPYTSVDLPGNESALNSTAGYLITSESGQTLSYDGGPGNATWSAVIAEIAPGNTVAVAGTIKLKKCKLSGTNVTTPSGYSWFNSDNGGNGFWDSEMDLVNWNSYGDMQTAITFKVTDDDLEVGGYYYWYDTAEDALIPGGFALWSTLSEGTGTVVDGSVINGIDTPTETGWQYVPLDTPVTLTADTPYKVEFAASGGFFWANAYTPFEAPSGIGITNGPLVVYSDAGGDNPIPSGDPQSSFTTATNEPELLIRIVAMIRPLRLSTSWFSPVLRRDSSLALSS